jgi:hypothetical protein
MYEEIGHSLFYLPPEQKKNEGTLKKGSSDSNKKEPPPLPDHLWIHILYDEVDMLIDTKEKEDPPSCDELVTETDESQ